MKEQKIKNKINSFSGFNFPQSIFHDFGADVNYFKLLDHFKYKCLWAYIVFCHSKYHPIYN